MPPPFAAAAAAAAAAAVRQYFKLPGEFVSLIQCDIAQRISSAVGQWLETVKVNGLEGVVMALAASEFGTCWWLECLAHGCAAIIRDCISGLTGAPLDAPSPLCGHGM
jgi:hypothetical protein